MDDPTRRIEDHLDIDEQELMRRYVVRLTDWSELGAINVYRNGKLRGPLAGLRKWKFKL